MVEVRTNNRFIFSIHLTQHSPPSSMVRHRQAKHNNPLTKHSRCHCQPAEGSPPTNVRSPHIAPSSPRSDPGAHSTGVYLHGDGVECARIVCLRKTSTAYYYVLSLRGGTVVSGFPASPHPGLRHLTMYSSMYRTNVRPSTIRKWWIWFWKSDNDRDGPEGELCIQQAT